MLAPLGRQGRLRILCQATDALLYLHTPVVGGKGVVIHRDFKPENILLDEKLNAYLADTGNIIRLYMVYMRGTVSF